MMDYISVVIELLLYHALLYNRKVLLNISVSIDLLLCESNIYITKIVVSLILLYSTAYSSYQCSSKRPFRSSRSSKKRCRSLSYLV